MVDTNILMIQLEDEDPTPWGASCSEAGMNTQ